MGIIQKIIDLVLAILSWCFNLLKTIFSRLFERFMEVNIIEKIIVVCFIPAVVAVVTPVCKYHIFKRDKYINNPIAEHLIGIVFVYFVFLYFKDRFIFTTNKVFFITCELLTLLYVIRLIYLHAGPGLIQTSYHITNGYYFNIVVGSIFALLSLINYLVFRKN